MTYAMLFPHPPSQIPPPLNSIAASPPSWIFMHRPLAAVSLHELTPSGTAWLVKNFVQLSANDESKNDVGVRRVLPFIDRFSMLLKRKSSVLSRRQKPLSTTLGFRPPPPAKTCILSLTGFYTRKYRHLYLLFIL